MIIEFTRGDQCGIIRYEPRIEVTEDGKEFVVLLRGADGLDRKLLAVTKEGVYRYVRTPVGFHVDADGRISDWTPANRCATNPCDPGESCRERAAEAIEANGGV